MKKLFFLFPFLILSACQNEVTAELSLEEVFLRENEELSFHFYLTQAKGLQTDYVYVSGTDDLDPESGTLCSDSSDLINCVVSVDAYSQPYLIKTTYENGDYSLSELTVPFPELMEAPSIVSPETTPAPGSTMEVSFEDTGADEYEVRVENCNEYNNDGINPCLDQVVYTVSMESGAPTLPYLEWEDYYEPTVSWDNGVITVRSNFVIQFEETVEYRVTAQQKTDYGYSWMSDTLSLD